jgi:hypothetical protein
MSVSTFGVSPHSSEAPANQQTPMTNTRRRPYRSLSEPPSSMSAASVSVYELIVHCRPAKSAPRSLPIRSSATFTTVASSMARLEPSTVVNKTHRARGVPIRRPGSGRISTPLIDLLSAGRSRAASESPHPATRT